MNKSKDPRSNDEFVNHIRVLELQLQLEKRKNQKLTEENQKLQTRITALLSKDDHKRLKLLVADNVRKQLSQLKAVTNRGIDSLQYIINQFDEFRCDVETEVEKVVVEGALNQVLPISTVNPQLLLPKFEPELSKIAESPAASNDTLTPEEDTNAVDGRRNRSHTKLVALEAQETSFVVQTPAGRGQNSRRRRALAKEDIENITPKLIEKDEIDIVEDSLIEYDEATPTKPVRKTRTPFKTLIDKANDAIPKQPIQLELETTLPESENEATFQAPEDSTIGEHDMTLKAESSSQSNDLTAQLSETGPSLSASIQSNEEPSISRLKRARTIAAIKTSGLVSLDLDKEYRVRPKRAAKAKIPTLKEPSLGKKMRRE